MYPAKDVATCIEHKDVTTMCRVCRDRDMAVINGKEYSADLAEYSKGFSDKSSENPKKGGNPNLTVISESGLYRILAKCNLPKCEPWFVSKDACDCLELGNVSQTCSRLDDDERGYHLK